jgi:hypothetical protein
MRPALLALVVSALLLPAPAYADFGISSLDVSPSTTQAGGHPDLSVHMTLADPTVDLKDLQLDLPPGLVANPLATSARCSEAQFQTDTCPAASVVGTTSADALADIIVPIPITATGQIFNMEPHPGEPARLGFKLTTLLFFTIRLESSASVRADDYGLRATITDIPTSLLGVTLTVTGISFTLNGTAPSGRPFVTNPTSCEPATVRARATPYGGGAPVEAQDSYTPTGCDAVPFHAAVDTTVDPARTETPAAYAVALNVPEGDSNVRRATVTLPNGTALNAALAQGLEACPSSAFGLGQEGAVTCPAASDVGDAAIDSPLLGIVPGQVYIGEPAPGDPYRLFVVIEGGGVRIKTLGSVRLDGQTGQVTTVFDNLPQLPFTSFTLSFRGGDRGVLVNPPDCGSHTVAAEALPWSGGPAASSSDGFDTSYDGAGAPCPSPQPFAPEISAAPSTTAAGASPALTLDLVRPDRNDVLRDVTVSMPNGFVGRLAGIPQCADPGACDPASRVGTVTAVSGAGGDPLPLTGPVYLGTGVGSDPASLISVLQAKAGPFDLGNVVLRSRLVLRPDGRGLDVISEGLPRILAGIPLYVRRISLALDRPGFLRNPTSCTPAAFQASFTSAGGSQATAQAPFQPTGCAELPFAPRFSTRIGSRGQTGPGKNPPLTTVITQGAGEAAVRDATVILPTTLTVNGDGLTSFCTRAQLAVRSCPAETRVGSATAVTPLLNDPLSGPVFAVRDPGDPLPGFGVTLTGPLPLILRADVGFGPDGGIVTTFRDLPDVPLSRFEFKFLGGPRGLLEIALGSDLCRTRIVLGARLVAQSGKTADLRSPAAADGCAPKLDISLRGLKGSAPKLVAKVTAPPGKALSAATLTLPKGLGIDEGRGVNVQAGGRRVGKGALDVSRRRLEVEKVPRGAARSITITLSSGALDAARSLRRRAGAGRRPALVFAMSTVDSEGAKSSVRKTVRGRP